MAFVRVSAKSWIIAAAGSGTRARNAVCPVRVVQYRSTVVLRP